MTALNKKFAMNLGLAFLCSVIVDFVVGILFKSNLLTNSIAFLVPIAFFILFTRRRTTKAAANPSHPFEEELPGTDEDLPDNEETERISKEVTIGSLALDQPIYKRATGEAFLKISPLVQIILKVSPDGSLQPFGGPQDIDPDEIVEVIHYTVTSSEKTLAFVSKCLESRNLKALTKLLKTLQVEEIVDILAHVKTLNEAYTNDFLRCIVELDAETIVGMTIFSTHGHRTIGSLTVTNPMYRRSNGEMYTKISKRQHVRIKLHAKTLGWRFDGNAETFDPNEVVHTLPVE